MKVMFFSVVLETITRKYNTKYTYNTQECFLGQPKESVKKVFY